ncbi:MAG TPA: ribbon-helix-helix protein, CopG family [Vicinamibacteria bacterium]|nr:ribbon-helix-helix protein, CopG family [Vicinamibacteria bacterium]
MKPIQMLIDEPLLRRLDADEEVRQVGRSEVLRRAAAAYLRRSRARRIAEAYQKAYGDARGLGDEWAGWENEGTWPAR